MQRDINFFSVYHSGAAGYDKATIAGLSVLLSCVVVMAGVFAFIKIDDATVQAQNRSISSFLAQRNVTSVASAVSEANRKTAYLKQYEALAAKNAKAFTSLPVVDSDLLGAIAKAQPADVTVSDLNYTDMAIKLTCAATDEKSAAVFTNALKASGKFDYATYDGVVKGGTSCSFTITCTLKGGGGQ
ncbi:PilN domain-containing protein [Ethanoligenens harbinense]|uniref:Fimbrial assembly family protein n=1 Tax=Ethanoligenens harbinense (strain DSM 18485 / JCM 12961 / CGMCC 1.5033 / YUAN-3) TaxID=663278 RepID=E6U302_ETHHY|nr:PilN domain-containing protein [Ethanoligenens harbinense]ADU26369.1 hypothetical protein Ethha_0800 [Ethanoligenens harbinense YUAN-3]AVQ95498.1 hypothetical protein CXQ68_04135 [Ethanoligenens harbinense YUAN-3]AYF38162.1 hypothetical protein CXP51_03990 [Ethanoligenens harbinense]AYF40907.1 hypothetical protein CN246_04125 [Ethanoligenens harbinense]QCN91739.1 hypothetical protein DRA42_04130 [Ethanoligenens harbinense]